MAGRTFDVQTIHLGQTGAVDTFNESTLNNGGAGPWLGQLGQIFEDSGKFYRLVKFDNGTGNVASAAGFVAHWKDKSTYTVTSDQTDAELGVNGVAGAFLGVITDGYYCFVQMGGDQTGVSVAAATAIGDQLSGSATDGQLAKTAAGTASVNKIVAIAKTAVSSGTSTVRWEVGALI